MHSFVVVACLLLAGHAQSAKLPTSYKRCKVSAALDGKPNECLRVAIEDAMHQLSTDGNKELGALDLDPLSIDQVLIEQGDDSPIAIKLKFTKNELIGLSAIKVKSVSGKLSSPKGFEMIMDSETESLSLVGPYTIDGKVLVLPIQGDGLSNLTLTNVKSRTVLTAEPQTKKGKEYLKVTGMTLNMEPDRMYTQLGNLFNGDKALGDNMNKFLNENWKDIYGELRPAVQGAFQQLLEAYTKRIMERVAFNNIFLVE